jgi:hypothetical protein
MHDGQVLRLDHGKGVLNKIPIPTQGKAAYCWAAVSTQFYDAYRVKEAGTSELEFSSALASSLIVLSKENRRSLSTVYSFRQAFHELANSGTCSLKSFFDDSKSGQQNSMSSLLQGIEQIYSLEGNYSLKYARFRQLVKEISNQQVYKNLFEDSLAKEQLKVMFYPGKTPIELQDKLVELLCPKSERLFLAGQAPRIVNLAYHQSPMNYQQLLKNRLQQDFFDVPNSELMPKVIGVCGKALINPKLRPLLNSSGTLSYSIDSNECSNHYLVVAGLRKRGDKCEWLARNSAPAACSEYVEGKIECEKGTDPRTLWIEENYLTSYISEMFTAEN